MRGFRAVRQGGVSPKAESDRLLKPAPPEDGLRLALGLAVCESRTGRLWRLSSGPLVESQCGLSGHTHAEPSADSKPGDHR